MAILKHKLAGSTVIEAIVASIIFLAVFGIAMDTLARLSSVKHDDSLLVAGIDLDACIHEFTTNPQSTGEYVRSYDWGEITITVARYKTRGDILELNFETTISPGKRKLRYRTLTATEPR